MPKLYLCLYKGNYAFWSRLIKWFTDSTYSHCEIGHSLLGDNTDFELIGISDEQHVRRKYYDIENNRDKWDVFEIPYEYYDKVMTFFSKTKGAKYDWKGILLTGIINRGKHNKNKYTCSEWVGQMLDEDVNHIFPKKYHALTPQDVFDYYQTFIVKK